MGRAKGIIDINISQAGQFSGKVGVVLFLFGVKAKVLQEDDFPGPHRPDGLFHLQADAVKECAYRPAEKPAQMLPHRCQAQLVVYSLRPAQVGHQYHGGSMVQKVGDGRQGGADAGIVPYPSFLEGHVEIHPHQDALSPNFDVADRLLGHMSSSR